MIVSELIDLLNTYDKNLTVVMDSGDTIFVTPSEGYQATMIKSRTQEYMLALGRSGGELPVVVLG